MREDHDALLDRLAEKAEQCAEAWRVEHLNDETRRYVSEAEEQFGADLRAARAEMLAVADSGVAVDDALELWERRYAEAEAQFHGICEIAAALTAVERGE